MQNGVAHHQGWKNQGCFGKVTANVKSLLAYKYFLHHMYWGCTSHNRMHEASEMEMGWGWGCALWVWGRDGSEMDGDVMGTVVRHMKMGWGWENVMGMGLIFTKTCLLYTSPSPRD